MLDAVVLAVALAMDATAVAAARGAAGVSTAGALRMAGAFGAFQGGMAAIGWAAGAGAARWIEAWDHWVAFGLLALIGGKMLFEAFRGGDEEVPDVGWRAILVLAVATSIDALAAGVTINLIAAPPPVTLALIAGVTLLLSLVGARLGAAIGARLGRGLEVAGGLALIAIGVKIVVEHT